MTSQGIPTTPVKNIDQNNLYSVTKWKWQDALIVTIIALGILAGLGAFLAGFGELGSIKNLGLPHLTETYKIIMMAGGGVLVLAFTIGAICFYLYRKKQDKVNIFLHEKIGFNFSTLKPDLIAMEWLKKNMPPRHYQCWELEKQDGKPSYCIFVKTPGKYLIFGKYFVCSKRITREECEELAGILDRIKYTEY